MKIFLQATPLIMGMAVAATAYAGRYGIQAWQAFKARPPTARMRKFYEGGFQSVMTRREAALILGVRYRVRFSTVKNKYIFSILMK
jgi:DnaJ family protein C protein 19